MKADDKFIKKLNNLWCERVKDVRKEDKPENGKAYIDTLAVVGNQDNIVQDASAQSMAHKYEKIDGDHFEVVKPKSLDCVSYSYVRDAITKYSIPRFIWSQELLLKAKLHIVEEAKEHLFFIGSRASDGSFLKAVEKKFSEEEIKIFRALLGRPKRIELESHINNLYSSLPSKPETTNHTRRLNIGSFEDTSQQTEVALIGNETRVLVILPASSIGQYDSAVTFTDKGIVEKYFRLTQSLIKGSPNQFLTQKQFHEWNKQGKVKNDVYEDSFLNMQLVHEGLHFEDFLIFLKNEKFRLGSQLNVGITGSWRHNNPEIKRDVKRCVREIISNGGKIITGGALGVDYIATEEVIAMKKAASQLQIIIPTSIETYSHHYLKKAEEGVISYDSANSLVEQLLFVKSLNKNAFKELSFSEVTTATYYSRNSEIVNLSNLVLGFQVNESAGTEDTIQKAKSSGKSTFVSKYHVRI